MIGRRRLLGDAGAALLPLDATVSRIAEVPPIIDPATINYLGLLTPAMRAGPT
jgi:hypothetical protein